MKPDTHVINLVNAISDPSRIRQGRERQIISLEHYAESMSFVLHKGTVGVYRSRDQLLVKHLSAPMIVGMNSLMNTNADFFYQASGEIQFEIIATSEVLETIAQKNLWQDASYTFMYAIKKLLEAHRSSVGLSTYELIRTNLIALMAEKEELRLAVNASDYIQEKTHLSRSRVMKILSVLRLGDHIVMERGILIRINRLPEQY